MEMVRDGTLTKSSLMRTPAADTRRVDSPRTATAAAAPAAKYLRSGLRAFLKSALEFQNSATNDFQIQTLSLHIKIEFGA